MINIPDNKEVTKYWLKHGINDVTGLCDYCGNHGEIHLSAIKSPAGNDIPARIKYCFCPNGQVLASMKGNGVSKKVASKKKK